MEREADRLTRLERCYQERKLVAQHPEEQHCCCQTDHLLFGHCYRELAVLQYPLAGAR